MMSFSVVPITVLLKMKNYTDTMISNYYQLRKVTYKKLLTVAKNMYLQKIQ